MLAGGDGDGARRRARSACKRPRGRRRRLPLQADQPAGAAGARALAAAHQGAVRHGAAPGRAARGVEPHARAARGRAGASRSSGWRGSSASSRRSSPSCIVAGGADDPLESHRREITVVFLDLRGFTAFAETAEPEEVMARARASTTRAMGRLHPRAPGHARALHRRRHDGVLQRSAADPRRRRARAVRYGARDAGATRSSSRRNGRSAATTWSWASASRRATPPWAPSASRGASTTAPSAP